MNIYTKWSLIVGFNAIFCMIFAFDFMKTVSGALGVIAGIACFILLYTKLDEFLFKTKRKEWLKALLIAAIVTGFFSLFPAMPVISGTLALDITGLIFNFPSSGYQHKGFFPIFLTTILTGLFLSLLVLILAFLLRVLYFKYPKFVKTGVDND